MSTPTTSVSKLHIGNDRQACRFKIATEDWEFEQIHRLNHATFVDEIPQHAAHPSLRLVDKFHNENTYVIAVNDAQVIAMTAIRGLRPFSLDAKVENLDRYLPTDRRVCEIRLLAVRREHRSGRLLQDLLASVWRHCTAHGYEAAVISGTMRQLKLYRHLGFESFGSPVGSATARFQPMMITREAAAAVAERLFAARHQRETPAINFLPGPIAVTRAVRKAFSLEPISHRSAEFNEDLALTRQALCRLTGARYAQILVGSGTLANDVVAAQLSLDGRGGIVLSNGEFGNRLIDHATRFGLRFEAMRWRWGREFDYQAVESCLNAYPAPRWLWFVQHETSTGVLNDLNALVAMCTARSIRLCVDAISSVGAMPVDLSAVHLGTAVSGKALGAFPGLAVVLHNHSIDASDRLPRYLDLGAYANSTGVPYSSSSNQLRALKTALEQRSDWPDHFRLIARRSRWLRTELRGLGLEVVAPESAAAAGILTVALPADVNSIGLGSALKEAGCEIATNSEYLKQRNWIQISTMTPPTLPQMRALVSALGARVSHESFGPSRRSVGGEVEPAICIEHPM